MKGDWTIYDRIPMAIGYYGNGDNRCLDWGQSLPCWLRKCLPHTCVCVVGIRWELETIIGICSEALLNMASLRTCAISKLLIGISRTMTPAGLSPFTSP